MDVAKCGVEFYKIINLAYGEVAQLTRDVTDIGI